MSLRTCLRCQREFTSTWCGHRLCDDCNNLNKELSRRLVDPPKFTTAPGGRVIHKPIDQSVEIPGLF